MLYSLYSTSNCSSLVEASSLVNIILGSKVVLWNFEFYFIVAVSRYFSTIDVSYLYWYNEIEWSLSCEILMDINQCAYPRNFTRNIFPSVSKTNSLVPHIYTNIHSHQYNITQLTWIHLVHTCNLWIFDIVTVWSLINL